MNILNLREKQNLRKVTKSLRIILTTPDEEEKYLEKYIKKNTLHTSL